MKGNHIAIHILNIEICQLTHRYHIRKIKAEFPIPGAAVIREQKRKKNIKEYTDGFVSVISENRLCADFPIINQFPSNRIHRLRDWINSTKKGLTREVTTRTQAAVDFLSCSETSRSSQRIMEALEPALIKRRRTFNRFTEYVCFLSRCPQ